MQSRAWEHFEMWYTPGTIMAVNVLRPLKGDYGAV